MARERNRYWGGDDLFYLGALPLLAAISWILPERHWRPVCAALGATSCLTAKGRRRARLIADILGPRRVGTSGTAIERRLAGQVLEARVGMLREYRPGGWQPRIQLSGARHIESALMHGRGAILWVGDFAHGELVTKKALAAAGFSVTHLSRPGHGLSTSRFGQKILNPIQIRTERRYLRERLVMHGDFSIADLRTLKRRLLDNGIVSITVGDQTRTPLAVPFLAGVVALAVGPIKLARATGAALLPLFTVRAPTGGFEIHIGPALDLIDGAGRPAPVEAAMRQYIDRLEGFVLADPSQWRGWRSVLPASVAEGRGNAARYLL